MKTEHEIKIDTKFYARVADGQKTFEIRKNDRDYQVGDVLCMREYDPKGEYYIDHSHMLIANIVYMSTFQQKEGYVVLGIEVVQNDE